MINDRPDGITELKNINISGGVWIDKVKVTSTADDINLLSGLVSGGITNGFVKVYKKEVTCAQGVATVTSICTIPVGSMILNVMTYCSEAFNGATTKTFEVGISGNTDKYIDPVDCGVTLNAMMDRVSGTNEDQKTVELIATTAAGVIQSVHTNTTGATAGKMVVTVIYV